MSRDATEEEQAILQVLLENYLDDRLPPTTVVDLRQDGRFLPVFDVIRTYPQLIENRSLGLQLLLVIGSLLVIFFLPWAGEKAYYVQAALFLASLVTALHIRSQATLRGRSSGGLLKRFWSWPHRRTTLAVLAAAEGLALVFTLFAARERSQFRDRARAVVPTIEAAVQSEDPCAVMTLDQRQIHDYASGDLEQKIRRREALCVDLKREGRSPAQLAQKKDRCEKAVAALKAGQPLDSQLVGTDPFGSVLRRVSTQRLELYDLTLKKDQIPCVDQGLWTLFVAAARVSPIWGLLQDAPLLDAPLQAELEKQKLAASVIPALKKNVEAVASQVAQKPAASDLQFAAQFCQMFHRLTTETSATCKALESRHQALKAQEEQAAKLKAAQAEQQEKAKEARCKSVTAQYQACNRRCDTLLFNGNDDAAMQCEENCGRTFPTKDCP